MSFDNGFENIPIDEDEGTLSFEQAKALIDKSEDADDAEEQPEDEASEESEDSDNGDESGGKEGGEETPTHTQFLLDQLEGAGIDFDPEDFKDLEYESQEEAVSEFKRMVALSKAKEVDPVYAELIENGVTLEEYLHQIQTQQTYLAKPDKELVQAALYSEAYNSLTSKGVIKPNEKGELSAAHAEKVKKASERALEDYEESDIAEYAKAVREDLRKQIQNTPEQISKARTAQIEENWSRASKAADIYVESFEKDPVMKAAISSISNATYDVKDFGAYVKENLKPVDSKIAGKEHAVIAKMKEDPKFLAEMLMLKYQQEKGLLKQIEKKAKTETAQKTLNLGNKKSSTSTSKNDKDEEARYLSILKR